MSPTAENTITLVFAKAPRPGLAKTRLAPLLGEEGAAALQAKLVEHALTTAREARTGEVELHTDAVDDDFLCACARRHDVRLMSQAPGDLGVRMSLALQQALAEHAHAILIGSDCPALTPQHLRLAACGLKDADDALFIPAEDGGYALVALRRYDARLFTGIAWSTSEVMGETRSRLRELGWRWRELEMLWDVDTPADYERLVSSGLLSGLERKPRRPSPPARL